ncbi:MAG: TonB family protein [Candidatus Kapaibacterium sp.]
MNPIEYLAESTISLAALWLFYFAFLKRDTNFRANRIYLMGSMFFSAIIPLLNIRVASAPGPAFEGGMLEAVAAQSRATSQSAFSISVGELITIVYIIISLAVMVRFLLQIARIRLLASRSKWVYINGREIVLTPGDLPPFSFLNRIYISENNFAAGDCDEIIAHEAAHISHYHFIDIIISQIILALQWANPFAWLARNSLKELHEYQADSDVLRAGCDPRRYKELLLSHAGGMRRIEFANGFSKSLIKSRFRMMSKQSSNRISLAKMLLAAPIVAVLFALFACSDSSGGDPFVYDNPDEQGQRPQVDEFPDFPGGYSERAEFINENLNYPEKAKENNITGKVYIRFEVEKDGSITNPRIAHARQLGVDGNLDRLGYGCDEEALRVVKMMPDWKPAIYKGEPVRYTTFLSFLFGDAQKWNAYNAPSGFGRRDKDNEVWVDNKENLDKKKEGVEMPAYKGDLASDMLKTLKYPAEAQKKGIEGMVVLDLTIDENGKLTKVEVIKSVDPALDSEALRVGKTLDKWYPGAIEGHPEKMSVKLPVKFKIK